MYYPYVRDPGKLLLATRTAVSLISLVHDALWDLYPDEMMLLREADENHLLAAIEKAIRDLPPPEAAPPAVDECTF